VKLAIQISETQSINLIDKKSGEMKLARGPVCYFPEPTVDISLPKPGIQLNEIQYLYLTNKKTGEVVVVKGPTLLFPEPTEEVSPIKVAISLKKYEFMQIMDGKTGTQRVVKGADLIFLNPTDEVTVLPRKGVNVDAEHAVLVRDLRSGQLELITEPQLFVPEAFQVMEKVEDKIRLESYHTAVIKDNSKGKMIFIEGPTSFFLEPYWELFTQTWSTGIQKDQRNLEIRLFDNRPHFMWYEFACRSRDNVELIVGVTFFWGLADVKALVKTTSDPSGDVCSHARSVIIQAVSRLSLEEFLGSFNEVVESAVLGKGGHSVSMDFSTEGKQDEGQTSKGKRPTTTTTTTTNEKKI